MSDEQACLNENHIQIPEAAAGIMYVKALRLGMYNAVVIPTFEDFERRGAHYVDKIVDCIKTDIRAECGICDAVFEARTKEDVSAQDQRCEHYRMAHPKPAIRDRLEA